MPLGGARGCRWGEQEGAVGGSKRVPLGEQEGAVGGARGCR